jgi:ribosomal protein L7/L12
MGKAMLTNKEAEWIMHNVYPVMSFEEVILFGQIMHKFHLGYYCTYIQESFLKKIIELCIDRDMIRYPMFYTLCSKLHSINSRNKENKTLYCIHFDRDPDVGQKIRSIKAMRELFRHDSFIGLVNKVFPSGLKEVKDFVDGDVCVGPYDLETINKIKLILNYSGAKIEKYVDQRTIEKEICG